MAEKPLTIPAVLESNNSRNSTRTVFTFPDQSSVTFAVFYNRVELLSEFLLRNGISRGDCVAFLDRNFTNLPIIYFAVSQIGAITVPISPALTDEELHFILKQNKVVAVFAAPELKERLKQQNGHTVKFFIDIFSFRFDALQADSVTQKFEKEFSKIKKAALEWVKPEEIVSPQPVFENDEIQRLILPDLHGQWQTYRYTHRHLISAAQMVSQTLSLNGAHKLLMILPFYFNLTLSVGVLGPLLSGYQVVFTHPVQNAQELEALIREHQPSHVFIESGLFEKIFKSAFQTMERPPLKRLWAFVKTKILGAKSFKFLKQTEWIFCTNLTPVHPAFNRFLLNNHVAHHFLFGIFETTSVLLWGKAFQDFCWVHGQPVKGLEVQVETTSGRLWVKGPNVLPTEKNDEEDFVPTPLIAEKSERGISILGFTSTVVTLANGQKIDARVLEAALRQLPQVEEALIEQENGQLVLKVVSDPDLLELPKVELENVLVKEIHQYFNETLPDSLHLSRISIQEQPFPRTHLGQILRPE